MTRYSVNEVVHVPHPSCRRPGDLRIHTYIVRKQCHSQKTTSLASRSEPSPPWPPSQRTPPPPTQVWRLILWSDVKEAGCPAFPFLPNHDRRSLAHHVTSLLRVNPIVFSQPQPTSVQLYVVAHMQTQLKMH